MIDNLKIFGARTNNLQNISLEIPKNKLVVFTGVSGSGKSSLVFDTIFSEAQRNFLESLNAYARTSMPKTADAKVDNIENLNPCIVINQKSLGQNPRSTVGTVTNIYTYLRLLYSRMGLPTMDSSEFSFNRPTGACENCKGLGVELGINLNTLLNMDKSLSEGAVNHKTWTVDSRYYLIQKNTGYFDLNKKLSNFSEDELNKLLYSPSVKIQTTSQGFVQNFSYEGIFNRLLKRQNDSRGLTGKSYDSQFLKQNTCQKCNGSRINKKARDVMLNGKSIVELSNMELETLYHYLENIKGSVADKIIPFMRKQLKHLVDIGLGYINLSRGISTLSGGEAQRLKLAKQLGNSLTGLIYILDEPTAGLHTTDVNNLISVMKNLRDKGNSVFVVEHDISVMKSADYIIDIGPKAGHLGGKIVAMGTPEEIQKSNSITGQYLSNKIKIERKKQNIIANSGILTVKNANLHNLKSISVDIPKGSLTVITGVSGSGKSSLVTEFIAQNPDSIVVSQKSIGRNVRSIPATYTKIFDDIRKEFSKNTGLNSALLSFNGKGACENCNGLGYNSMDMHFLGDVKETCSVCNGLRYKSNVLKYKYKNKTMADILNMNIDEAIKFFETKKIRDSLSVLSNVGLDYLTLGQPLSTLSGGEAQRVKLASYLKKKGGVYILDEPTSGLHMADVKKLLEVLDNLVKQKNTVIIVEHNLDMIRNADWIIELGPKAGKLGGKIIFEGVKNN